jgi:hypothetical protein
MTYYTSDGNSYTGMSMETVIALRADLGRTTTFIDETTYTELLKTLLAHQYDGI